MKKVMYQPVLSVEEWETGKLPSFGVYHNFDNARKDYPNHTIAAYGEDEIEEPTYMDKNETAVNVAIAQAMNYLCDNESTHEGQLGSIKNQIEAIASHAKNHPSDYIDNVDGVIVWEKVTNTFECDEFLQLIEWPE